MTARLSGRVVVPLIRCRMSSSGLPSAKRLTNLTAAVLALALNGCHLFDDGNPEVRRPVLLRADPPPLIVSDTLRVGQPATVKVATVREPGCGRPGESFVIALDPHTVDVQLSDYVQTRCADTLLVSQIRSVTVTPAVAGTLTFQVRGLVVPGDSAGSYRTATHPIGQGSEVVAVIATLTVTVVP